MKSAAQEERAGASGQAPARSPWFAALQRIWDSFGSWRVERRLRKAAERYFKGLS